VGDDDHRAGLSGEPSVFPPGKEQQLRDSPSCVDSGEIVRHEAWHTLASIDPAGHGFSKRHFWRYLGKANEAVRQQVTYASTRGISCDRQLIAKESNSAATGPLHVVRCDAPHKKALCASELAHIVSGVGRCIS
jgi:hypothetical protein